ncbi:MAG: hypothetical protein A2583_13890 [Bdellovibrionales bacterium RIFOXYD1_FULL_53_11]|nr:MAG: hypothetical protein A2583_13890 [Bdellovibrionales bacterium RIFOXYD1_FULL_53_11]
MVENSTVQIFKFSLQSRMCDARKLKRLPQSRYKYTRLPVMISLQARGKLKISSYNAVDCSISKHERL